MTEVSPHERVVVNSPDDTVELRQLVPEDAPDYFGLIKYDPAHLSQFGDITATKYPDEETVRESILKPENPNKYRFGIWDGDLMVGSNNLTPKEKGTAELGWWIGKEHIGQHYAARACKPLIGFAFGQLGLKKVFCKIKVGNEASRKVAEAAGLHFESTQENEWIFSLENPQAGSND